jgi:tyrosyl-tRNA synthetase
LLVGRDLMKEEGLEPQVVLTVPLLVGLDGKEKMSKSLGNHIALEDPAREYFGKTMSIPDDLMWDWYLLLTDLPEAEILQLKRRAEDGELHPRKVKEDLAMKLTADYHGQQAAEGAREEFEKVFSGRGLPDEIPEIEVGGPGHLQAILTEVGLTQSKSEARRLIEQGAISIDGNKASDVFLELTPRTEPYLCKVGKRRFAYIRIL